jgi:POT family proton-dependent oligopeptide transporter
MDVKMTDSQINTPLNKNSLFLGHPKGLAYLSFTEAWERFSFYGMQSLVVLYMVQELFLTGHIENVLGMASYRAALESVFGPLSAQALASQTFGFYVGMVYFTPMLGGWIADSWLGAKKTVMIGVALMTAGHAAMVFEQSFLLALALLVAGSGCLKGNIAAQVGQLYATNDESGSTRGYAIFSTAINIGAVFGPLVCGALAQVYGWHYGFGAAGVFMVLASIVYWSGRSYLPDESSLSRPAVEKPKLTIEELRTVGLLFIMLTITVFQSITYDQLYNVGLVFIANNVDLNTALGEMPVGWFISINSMGSVLSAPFLIWWWKNQSDRACEPNDFTKMAIGAFVIAAGGALLMLSSLQLGADKVGIMLPIVAYFITGIGFMWYWPILLAIVARYAPTLLKARMMAMVYLTAFVSGVSSGFIGSLYEQMTPFTFWTLNALLAFFGGVIFLIFGKTLKHRLAKSTEKFLQEGVTGTANV